MVEYHELCRNIIGLWLQIRVKIKVKVKIWVSVSFRKLMISRHIPSYSVIFRDILAFFGSAGFHNSRTWGILYIVQSITSIAQNDRQLSILQCTWSLRLVIRLIKEEDIASRCKCLGWCFAFLQPNHRKLNKFKNKLNWLNAKINKKQTILQH